MKLHKLHKRSMSGLGTEFTTVGPRDQHIYRLALSLKKSKKSMLCRERENKQVIDEQSETWSVTLRVINVIMKSDI